MSNGYWLQARGRVLQAPGQRGSRGAQQAEGHVGRGGLGWHYVFLTTLYSDSCRGGLWEGLWPSGSRSWAVNSTVE